MADNMVVLVCAYRKDSWRAPKIKVFGPLEEGKANEVKDLLENFKKSPSPDGWKDYIFDCLMSDLRKCEIIKLHEFDPQNILSSLDMAEGYLVEKDWVFI